MKRLLKICLFSILKGRKEMKKIGALGIVIYMIALCPQVASAVFYTYSDIELSDMDMLWSNPDGNELLYYEVILGTGEYVVQFNEFAADGFAQVGIGAEDYYLPSMSDYEGIQLTFNNSSYSPMFANLFVQTNETDGGYLNFYDNTWTELAVGETITMNLNFSAANHYVDGDYLGVEAVGSLDTIFKWGFQIGSNEDYSSIAHGTVNPAPVPEPATVMLVGTGLLGMIAFGRKRFIKKI